MQGVQRPLSDWKVPRPILTGWPGNFTFLQEAILMPETSNRVPIYSILAAFVLILIPDGSRRVHRKGQMCTRGNKHAHSKPKTVVGRKQGGEREGMN
jgi:hypothetical protein